MPVVSICRGVILLQARSRTFLALMLVDIHIGIDACKDKHKLQRDKGPGDHTGFCHVLMLAKLIYLTRIDNKQLFDPYLRSPHLHCRSEGDHLAKPKAFLAGGLSSSSERRIAGLWIVTVNFIDLA